MKQVAVYTPIGKSTGKISLPDELFGQKPNDRLLSQAYYVYQTRAHTGTHKAKTRGEVAGSTAKIYRQKGTGRARHGMKKAPIFVGGGVVHGPVGAKRKRHLPQKFIRAALAVALSRRLDENKLFFIDPKEIDGKTKSIVGLLKKLGLESERLLILHGGEKAFVQGARNIAGITLLPASDVNAYEVINHPNVVLTIAGLELMKASLSRASPKAMPAARGNPALKSGEDVIKERVKKI
ncbi:50S ribosomal protein L4 [Candidatus Microgenomates bacterium]|nr:50S ribosomal protein L4 [Candidatus Microgenomates bacterium]